ncbi:GDP-mannose 4,6-dehydratase [Sediminibacterium sp. KACHI17]|uniref:GDP-mannose 4,6-dehydratase n=1 Tax=Sediminibacterium sp. KACHI17 TaxID=1751071 RepID=A0AAT9GI89_9BACT
MNAIIFGASGQDGFYLQRLLSKKNINVIPVARSVNEGFITGNVGDTEFVFSLIRKYLPDYIFHLAAVSTTKHEHIFENNDAIQKGTINILEGTKLYNPKSRIFLSGSAMQFKNDGKAINESTPFEASSAYSVQRISSVYAGQYYRNFFGLKVYAGYLFNHDSPLRSEKHINQKISKMAKRIAAKVESKLIIGNLNVEKEFSFAGDIVEAMWTLVNQDSFYEAVLGSGISYPIRDWIDISFKLAGLNWQEYVQVDNSFVTEYSRLLSDPALIKSTGWLPKVDFYQLAEMMYNS